jgi:uncharacterized membrane protein YuzA (DUF378 family)
MKNINKIALILCIIGGINWGAIGLFQFDIVAWIFGGQDSPVSRIIYFLVFVGALFCVPLLFTDLNDPTIPQKKSDIPDIGIS